jgi:hypothetical protein
MHEITSRLDGAAISAVGLLRSGVAASSHSTL